METITRKGGKGRCKRTSIEKIKNKDALYSCFTRHHKGIFKKAGELTVLCGAQIAILTLSPSGKPFSFTHPSTKAIINQYLNLAHHQVPIHINTHLEVRLRYLKCKLKEQSDGRLWWEVPIDWLKLEELVVMKGAMESSIRLS